jgi:hypothetical protein
VLDDTGKRKPSHAANAAALNFLVIFH